MYIIYIDRGAIFFDKHFNVRGNWDITTEGPYFCTE